MRVLVCGGRDYTGHDDLFTELDRLHCEEGPISVIIHGDQLGADTYAKWWATERGVPHAPFKAEWGRYGKSAGPVRNRRMIVEGKPDLVVAFKGGKGTADMVRQAMRAAIPVQEIE